MQFNCSFCSKKFPKLPDKLKEHQKRLGCDGSVNPGLVFLPSFEMTGHQKIKYDKCIGNFFNFKAMDLIKYYGKWKENLFPYPGGYYDQPAKFVECMELVDNLIMQKNSEKEQTLKRCKR